MAQMVKNLPAIWETRVRSQGQEDSLEEGMVIHSSILAWRIPMDGEARQATIHGVAKSQTRLNNFTFFLSLSVYKLLCLTWPQFLYL